MGRVSKVRKERKGAVKEASNRARRKASAADLKVIRNLRKAIVHMVHYSQTSHVGSALSAVEILYVLYFKVLRIDPKEPDAPDRDKFLLSKAHGSVALYATLAEKGFFPKNLLERYCVENGLLPGHLDRESVPGVEISAGSLGHGLSIGLGMALANRFDGKKGRVYVLLGDGECNEGSVWEAAMLASTRELKNITAIVDYNKLQGFGRTHEVIDQRSMPARWKAFGWEVCEVDGHDIEALEKSLKAAQRKPKVVIAHTVKGKGVSFMEDKLEWHYKSPNDKQYDLAIQELGFGP